MQFAGMDLNQRNQEQNIFLLSLSSPDISWKEVISPFVKEIEELENGKFFHHAGLDSEVFVIGGLYCFIADMPQANEICNCKAVGKAAYPCRKCYVLD